MSFPATLPAAILETILTGLAALFLTGAQGDGTAARHAAAQMLAAYHPENEDELRLAANIVSFSFQALDALARAAAPDTSGSSILRLRSNAIGLSREAGRAERRLGQLQKARGQQKSAESAPEPVQSRANPNPIPTAPAVQVAAKTKELTWTRAYEARQREARLAASLKRAEAGVAALGNAPAPPIPDHNSQSVAHSTA
jgi:hypothetical protein